MQVFRFPKQTEAYALATTPPIVCDGVPVISGIAHWSKGTRSPDAGMRSSAAHEFVYVVRGRVQYVSAEETLILEAGDVTIQSPSVPHSAVALEDSDVYFVLVKPLSEAQKAAQAVRTG